MKARSVIAIIAGYIVSALLVLMTFAFLGSMFPLVFQVGQHPPLGWLLVTLAISAVYAFLGGLVTALLAPHAPVRHAMTLGIVMFLLGIISAFLDREAAPLWWHISLLVLVIPIATLGGYARTKKDIPPAGMSSPPIKSPQPPTPVKAPTR